MKYIINLLMLILLTTLTYGCERGHPAPELAVKSCVDSRGIPEYKSHGIRTTFTCIPIEILPENKSD